MQDTDIRYTIIPTHISQINIGNTIKCRDGVIRTISSNNIHRDKLMGITIFGDSYNIGYIPVEKVVIFHAR